MRSPFLPGFGFARAVVLAAFCLALAVAGCKKDKPASKATAEKQKAPAEQPAPTPSKDEPDQQVEPAAAPVEDVAAEEAAPEVKEEVAAPEQGKPAAQGTPSADSVPPPAVDFDRLRKVFVALWCAEQKGASPEEVLKLYHEYDYPPLENWYDIWGRAVIKPGWAQSILQEARATCPPPDDGPEVNPTKVLDNLPVPAGAKGAPGATAPTPEPTAEPTAEPKAEPTAEPKAEPTAPEN